ncbi:MAG: hypothetical protein J0M09_10680 [Xanthomonadales bacterium]|nr:hypothetical protein [Xanthomonadales bacterium]
MKPSLEKNRVHAADDTALDVAADPFLFDLNWSAQELTDAMCSSIAPLHHFAFAPPANDAAMHRPRRRAGYVAIPPLPARFRIGG